MHSRTLYYNLAQYILLLPFIFVSSRIWTFSPPLVGGNLIQNQQYGPHTPLGWDVFITNNMDRCPIRVGSFYNQQYGPLPH